MGRTGIVILALASVLGIASRPKLAAALPNEACEFPAGLERIVATKYPGAKVITLSDLEDDDRKLFQSDHENTCPGMINVDFYGDGRQTVAMVLKAEARNVPTKLVLAHRTNTGWETKLLETGGPDAPVVWSQPPGEYQDVYGEKQIRATRSVIVFCKYESWAILYAWTGTGIKKVWIMD
jgi:hypothetical protein